jgi:hypothetical protein
MRPNEAKSKMVKLGEGERLAVPIRGAPFADGLAGLM